MIHFSYTGQLVDYGQKLAADQARDELGRFAGGATDRGKGAMYGSRFEGAEFGKKRTGPTSDWKHLGKLTIPHPVSGEHEQHDIYQHNDTGDRVAVDKKNRVSVHISGRRLEEVKQ
jgi:hypothetical protein